MNPNFRQSGSKMLGKIVKIPTVKTTVRKLSRLDGSVRRVSKVAPTEEVSPAANPGAFVTAATSNTLDDPKDDAAVEEGKPINQFANYKHVYRAIFALQVSRVEKCG